MNGPMTVHGTARFATRDELVVESIARAFPFRHVPSETRARTVFMLADGDMDVVAERVISLRPTPIR
jgi:hypothetical protein